MCMCVSSFVCVYVYMGVCMCVYECRSYDNVMTAVAQHKNVTQTDLCAYLRRSETPEATTQASWSSQTGAKRTDIDPGGHFF